VMMALPVSSTRMFPWTNCKGESKCRITKCTNTLQISVDDGRLYHVQVRNSGSNLSQLEITLGQFLLVKYPTCWTYQPKSIRFWIVLQELADGTIIAPLGYHRDTIWRLYYPK
jgi:hypothetical protein